MSRILLGLSFVAASLHAGDDPPHVVFLMTDDQAPWAIGSWDGPTHASTPHLDALFAEGARFTNSFVVTPVCSPSRASTATSRYGSELGITDWIHPVHEPELGLDPDVTTWFEELQEAGYHTGLIGKWHLGTTDAHHPTRTGFDVFMGHRAGGWKTKDPTLEKDGEDRRFDGLTTDILTDEAIAFLEARPDDRPFLLCLHFRAPHTAWLPVADEDWAPFADLDPTLPHPDFPGLDVARAKRVTREYLASVRGVDRNVGRLLAALERLGLRDDTVVIFTSDHGYNMGHNGVLHKGNGHWLLTKDALPEGTENVPRGQRPNMFDTSLRVPTAIVWPGVTTPGTVIDATVTNLDWYPTLVRIGDASMLPPWETIRGRDLAPLLTGDEPEGWNHDLFAQFTTHHRSTTAMRAYRTPDLKLVRDLLNPERDEAFDLRRDPEETTNVIADPAYAERIADLHARLRDAMAAIDDPLVDEM